MEKFRKVLVLFLASVFAGIFLIGCASAPEGYVAARNAPIINSQSKSPISFGIRTQFPDLVSYYDKETAQGEHFLYNEELYYFGNAPAGKEPSTYSFSIYKLGENDEFDNFGSLISSIDSEADRHAINISFLEGQYIYYQCRATYDVKYSVPIPTAGGPYGGGSYYKYAFYRFDMETAKNESIKLELLFEKLVLVSGLDYIIINPDYKP